MWYNGAGKSTIVKLLLRFYDPENGSLCIDSRDYKDFEPASLRSKFGAVFQNYKCYALSVGENVLFEEVTAKKQEDQVTEALRYSGIYEKIAELEKGVNTCLSREFDNEGIPLSGGEEQKIAIARAFADNKEILILDEPSSALEPQ
ncbi:MAG: ABC transporter ATP-binding protein/permease [Treponema sp.]|nr:ABC transporter ATP-binding protein/permease [Treponema sp.]